MVVAWNYGVERSSSPFNHVGDEYEPIDVERNIPEIPTARGAHFLVEDTEFDAPANGLVDRKSNNNKTDDLPEIIRAPASKRRHISASSFRHDVALTSRAHVAEQGVSPDPRPKASFLYLSTEVLLL